MPKLIQDVQLERNGKSSTLAVLVHGYYKDPDQLADVKNEIMQQLPDADVLRPIYNQGPGANADPFELAATIETLIDESYKNSKRVGNGGYQRITLVGYSLGALLLRKAYVYGLGSTEDSPAGETPAHEWVERVDRVVLIAGTNRGWSFEEKPEDMSWSRFVLIKYVVVPFGRIMPFWRFLKSFERGSPFVADLRVQWVRLVQNDPNKVAPVIQLLGTIDSLVSAGDDRDLYVHKAFIFIPVQGASHTTLVKFDSSEVGTRSRNKFIEGLTEDIDKLRARYAEQQFIQQDRTDMSPKHIVFVLHGIRDFGGWTGELRKELERVATNLQMPVPKVVTAKYDFFPFARFVLLAARQKNVRWFMDEYTERIATYPNPNTQVSFVGHSNGTYILASALKKYKTVRVHRAYFAGSAVHREYPWEQIIRREGRLKSLRNDLAAADWAVAIFPKLWDRFNISDIGSGGFDGFNDDAGNQLEGRYYKGGHGAAIATKNHESIANYILTGEVKRKTKLMTGSQSSLVAALSRGFIFVWLLIIVVAMAPIIVIAFMVKPRLARYLLWFLYSLFVMYVLNHV